MDRESITPPSNAVMIETPVIVPTDSVPVPQISSNDHHQIMSAYENRDTNNNNMMNIGLLIGKTRTMKDAEKYNALCNLWVPTEKYKFPKTDIYGLKTAHLMLIGSNNSIGWHIPRNYQVLSVDHVFSLVAH
ncbi:uncharacterized protein LOC141914588 [Tubulanus polymorphus]|uniref:uncharacterized protein LOC141914588 n=1 Tax=Tubulanus polymorphus TaxID=672921 RepID=UPI003DA5F05C